MEDVKEAAPAAEVTAPSDVTAPENTTPVETTETTPETPETPEAETSAEETKPRSLNRTQRLQRKAARLSTMVAEQAAEIERLRAQSAPVKSEPKEADFNGDYFAYQRALSRWDAEQLLEKALPKQEPKPDTAAPDREEFFSELRERIEEVKPLLPDFWDKLQGLSKEVGDLNVTVFDELDKAENPEAVLYHIASNPRLAAKLNKLSPTDVVREITRLDATVSLPKPKKQTQAPAPLTPPTGGAAPPKDISSAAKSDDLTAFIKMRDEEERNKKR